jgi:hypothetical protein
VLCRLVGRNAETRNMEHGYEGREGNPIPKKGRIRLMQVGGVGFIIATRMDEEQAAYCNVVGIWVKVGGETYRERWRPHRRRGLLEMVLASKKERLIYPKDIVSYPQADRFP